MKCDCGHIEPVFMQAMEGIIDQLAAPGSADSNTLYEKLRQIATECGYGKVEREGWVQFPEQDKALRGLGVEYDIIQEHDDGDLTIRIPHHQLLAVVTTDGQVFTKPE